MPDQSAEAKVRAAARTCDAAVGLATDTLDDIRTATERAQRRIDALIAARDEAGADLPEHKSAPELYVDAIDGDIRAAQTSLALLDDQLEQLEAAVGDGRRAFSEIEHAAGAPAMQEPGSAPAAFQQYNNALEALRLERGVVAREINEARTTAAPRVEPVRVARHESDRLEHSGDLADTLRIATVDRLPGARQRGTRQPGDGQQADGQPVDGPQDRTGAARPAGPPGARRPGQGVEPS
jgi:hypothetical protein